MPRKPQYLSPSSIFQFYDDRDEFYRKYLAENRPARFPQTQPMACGSAFDAYIKAFLAKKLGLTEARYSLVELLNTQLEVHNRGFGVIMGGYLFEQYLPAAADLLLEIEGRGDVVMEGDVRKELWGVPVRGKPDMSVGKVLIVDWKVNGAMSKSSVSPAKFYKNCGGKAHKGYVEQSVCGFRVGKHCLSQVDLKWALQTCIYAGLLGVEEPQVVGIDQLVGKNVGAYRRASDSDRRIARLCGISDLPEQVPMPVIRVAQHRCVISKEFRDIVKDKMQHVWSIMCDPTIEYSDEEIENFESIDYTDPTNAWMRSIGL